MANDQTIFANCPPEAVPAFLNVCHVYSMPQVVVRFDTDFEPSINRYSETHLPAALAGLVPGIS